MEEGQEVMSDLARKLGERIQSETRKAQKGLGKGLVDKIVRRAGVRFRVVSIDKNVVVVSGMKTAANQTSRLTLKSFLSKKIVVED